MKEKIYELTMQITESEGERGRNYHQAWTERIQHNPLKRLVRWERREKERRESSFGRRVSEKRDNDVAFSYNGYTLYDKFFFLIIYTTL